MAQGLLERFDSPAEEQRLGNENTSANVRVAIPGIIVSFDPANQTATVQPAISENVRQGQGEAKPTNLPQLTDVPVVFPKGGGFCLTFPVKEGDECLLVFSDMCIDGWWQSGGVQNQMETRRHDLSDAQALLGMSSEPNAVSGYSSDTVQLRNDAKSAFIEIDGGGNINMKAGPVNIEADVVITGETTIKGIAFTPHVHSGVMAGGANTGRPQ